MTYGAFRTGLTFSGVREILLHEQQTVAATGQYMFVSRATVLGRWREIKLQMWDQYTRRAGVDIK